MQHAAHLEQALRGGPHTVSVRASSRPTARSLASSPPHAVPDADFRKLIAILRLAVRTPASSCRRARLRRSPRGVRAGVSQISAGSRTNPGGYTDAGAEEASAASSSLEITQLDEVVPTSRPRVHPLVLTACYRLGRTGPTSWTSRSRRHQEPPAIPTRSRRSSSTSRTTGSPQTRAAGERLIADTLERMEPGAGSWPCG